ncbi:MAG TPA: MFS transporter [Verrucomicrobiae bacterium]|jgi:fucose permease|nr:MFS transporter [Verrucomicrobiae bacterium]
MSESKKVKAAVFYLGSFVQGLCLILLPGSSFVLKSPDFSGITDPQYGLVFLPMVLTAAACTLAFARLEAVFKRPRLFYAGYFANLLFLIFLGLVRLTPHRNMASFGLLLTANFFLGLGFGLFFTAMNLYIVDLFSARRDALLAGMHAFLGIGAAVSPLLAGHFIRQGNWPASVSVTLLALILVGLACRLTHAHRMGPLSGIVSRPPVPPGPFPAGARLFLVTVFFYGIVESTIGNWSVTYLNQDKGFSEGAALACLSVFWFSLTAGRLAAAFYAARFEPLPLYRISPFLIMGALAANLANREEARVLLIYAATGFGCSYFFPLSISLSTRFYDRWRDTLAGGCVAALMLGVGVGSSLAGFLRDRGWMNLDQTFMAALGCAAVVAVLAWILSTSSRPA